MESALEAASLHPAQLLGLEKLKGTLDFGADAGQGPMWGGLGSLKVQEFLGGLGQGQGGRGWNLPYVQAALPSQPASVRSHFPSRPGFLTSETRSGRGLLGPLFLSPAARVLVPGPQSVCAGSGHPLLHKLCPRLWFSHQPWAGVGGAAPPLPPPHGPPLTQTS